jgi:hypothetical protein
MILALLYALLMNGLPLAAVAYTGASPGVLLLLYWFETVLMIVTGASRILLHRRATAKAGHYVTAAEASRKGATAASVRQALDGKNDFLWRFLGINAIFTVAHGVIVFSLVFLLEDAGPVSWEDARQALVYAVVVQGVFLLWDLPQIRGWSFAQLAHAVDQVKVRVLVTQVGIFIGFAVGGVVGSAWGLVGTLAALRAICDTMIVRQQRLWNRRDLRPDVARAMARHTRQSVESIEAQFDAVKRDIADIEALLERPISEVKR